MFNTTQTIQAPYQQSKKSVRNPAQQKQRKQLVLNENKNIFAECLQTIKSLKPAFMTDSIRNFVVRQIQRNQLILTNSKDIFTYRFHPNAFIPIL